MCVHLVIKNLPEHQNVVARAKNISKYHGISNTTIQVEVK